MQHWALKNQYRGSQINPVCITRPQSLFALYNIDFPLTSCFLLQKWVFPQKSTTEENKPGVGSADNRDAERNLVPVTECPSLLYTSLQIIKRVICNA